MEFKYPQNQNPQLFGYNQDKANWFPEMEYYHKYDDIHSIANVLTTTTTNQRRMIQSASALYVHPRKTLLLTATQIIMFHVVDIASLCIYSTV